MRLKKEYEMTFKEGLRLGMRLTQAKAYIQNARDAKRLGDDTMAELYMGFAKDWNDLARNAGRKFTPAAAHEPEQPAIETYKLLKKIAAADDRSAGMQITYLVKQEAKKRKLAA